MATLTTSNVYILERTGRGEFEVTGRLTGDTTATADASDDQLSLLERFPVTFEDPTTQGIFGGDYRYIGHIPGT